MNTKLLFTTACFCCLLTGGCHKNNEEPSDTYDEGIEINGVVWATRNVGKPGTFAATREDPGMVYQWNSRVGWVCEDGEKKSSDGSEWLTIITPAATWSKTNDPCPNGWHIPTYDEAKKLVDFTDVLMEHIVKAGEEGVPIPTFIEKRIQKIVELFITNELRPGYVIMNESLCINHEDWYGWPWKMFGYYWISMTIAPNTTIDEQRSWRILSVDCGQYEPYDDHIVKANFELRYAAGYEISTAEDHPLMPLPIRCVRD